MEDLGSEDETASQKTGKRHIPIAIAGPESPLRHTSLSTLSCIILHLSNHHHWSRRSHLLWEDALQGAGHYGADGRISLGHKIRTTTQLQLLHIHRRLLFTGKGITLSVHL
jgi:hypothetical protein